MTITNSCASSENFSDLISQRCVTRYALYPTAHANVVNQYCAEGHQKCNRILNDVSASCSFAADIPSLRQLSFPRGIAGILVLELAAVKRANQP